MSFTLIDSGTEGFELTANAWTWKPTLEIIRSFDIVSDATLRQITNNATGTMISQTEAHAIGNRLRQEILPKLKPNKRIFADLSITDSPDDGTLYRDQDEQWKNYSASYKWLDEFAEFCLRSKGFQVF